MNHVETVIFVIVVMILGGVVCMPFIDTPIFVPLYIVVCFILTIVLAALEEQFKKKK